MKIEINNSIYRSCCSIQQILSGTEFHEFVCWLSSTVGTGEYVFPNISVVYDSATVTEMSVFVYNNVGGNRNVSLYTDTTRNSYNLDSNHNIISELIIC